MDCVCGVCRICWGTGSIYTLYNAYIPTRTRAVYSIRIAVVVPFILLRNTQNTNRQFSVWQRNYLNCSSYYTYTLGVTMKEANDEHRENKERKETEQNRTQNRTISQYWMEMYFGRDGNAYRTNAIQLKTEEATANVSLFFFCGLSSPRHVCRCRPSSSMSPVNGASIYFYWDGLGTRQRKRTERLEEGGRWGGIHRDAKDCRTVRGCVCGVYRHIHIIF